MPGNRFIKEVHNNEITSSSRLVNSENEGLYLKLAKISRVDYETMHVDLVYIDSFGAIPRVNVTASYAGYRSFLGAMPSQGDWVIVGFNKSGNFKKPYIVQFLPRDYSAGVRNDLIGVPKSFEKRNIYQPMRFRMHKLYEGEIYGASKQGSEIHLDKNITIANSKLNEIAIDSATQSITSSSINNFINTSGTRVYSGFITRNNLINNPNFMKNGISLFPTHTNENGSLQYIPNFSNTINVDYPYGKESLDDGNKGFIEHRLEVQEMADPITPVTNSNCGVDVDTFYQTKLDGSSTQPLIEQVFGTLVGNNSNDTLEKNKYGKILKPRIFRNIKDFNGKLVEDLCFVDEGRNETTTLAAAYALKFPKSGTAFYVNKQGKYFANLASSTSADPLGSGESAEININGHTKMYMGKNDSYQRSFSLETAGGFYTNLGFDNQNGRSWDATFRKGISLNILGKDKNNYAYYLKTEGDVKEEINGSRRTVIKGNDIRLVHGVLEDRVFGKKIDNFINDKATNYGGAYNETTIGHYSQIMSAGKECVIYAPNITQGDTTADKTDIKLGDSELNMLLGSRKESIKVGSHETSIIAGNKSISITAGNYSLNITAGNIDIKTTLGSVTMQTLTGTVDIQGTLGVNIKSAVAVNLEAPKSKIGSLPQGGVVNSGPCGAKCYFSGAPHLGSATVTVNTI